MSTAGTPLAPPPWLGSGEVPNRFRVELVPPAPLPWYYNQATQAAIAGALIAILVAVGVING